MKKSAEYFSTCWMPSLVLKASSCPVTKMKKKELNAANGISVFQKQQVTFDPKYIRFECSKLRDTENQDHLYC